MAVIIVYYPAGGLTLEHGFTPKGKPLLSAPAWKAGAIGHVEMVGGLEYLAMTLYMSADALVLPASSPVALPGDVADRSRMAVRTDDLDAALAYMTSPAFVQIVVTELDGPREAVTTSEIVPWS
jgi:hypothetical protein